MMLSMPFTVQIDILFSFPHPHVAPTRGFATGDKDGEKSPFTLEKMVWEGTKLLREEGGERRCRVRCRVRKHNRSHHLGPEEWKRCHKGKHGVFAGVISCDPLTRK